MAGHSPRDISLVEPGRLSQRCQVLAQQPLLLGKLWRLASHYLVSSCLDLLA
jgi:hypothetical protein